MSQSFFLRSINSDLSIGGALFNRQLLEDTATAASQEVSLTASQTVDAYAFTEPGVPGVDGGNGAGDYTVSIHITSGATHINVSSRLARVDSDGVVQAEGDFSTPDPGNAGIKVHEFEAFDFGTWQAGDRLRVQYRFVNTDNMMTRSLTIELNTVETEVTTPWEAEADDHFGSLSIAGQSAITLEGHVPTGAIFENWECPDSALIDCQLTWTTINGGFTLVSNRAASQSGGQRNIAVADTQLASEDMRVEVLVTPHDPNSGCGPIARASNSVQTHYYAQLHLELQLIRITRTVNGTNTNLADDVPFTVNADQEYKVALIVADEGDDVRVIVEVDDVEIHNVLDTSPITGFTRAGIRDFGQAGGSSFDTFQAGPVGGAFEETLSTSIVATTDLLDRFPQTDRDALMAELAPIAWWQLGTDTADQVGTHDLTWFNSPDFTTSGGPISGADRGYVTLTKALSQYATIANDESLDRRADLAFETWVRAHREDETTSAEWVFHAHSGDVDEARLFALRYDTVNDRFSFMPTTTQAGALAFPIDQPDANEWQHIVCNVHWNPDGTRTIQIFANGVPRVPLLVGHPAGVGQYGYQPAGTSYASSIGRSLDTTDPNFFDGDIAEISFYDRILRPSEIKDLFGASYAIVQAIDVGTLSESDTLNPLAAQKTAGVGVIEEAGVLAQIDAAQPAVVAVGVIAEADTLADVRGLKVAPVGTLFEVGILESFSAAKVSMLGQVTEVDGLNAVFGTKTASVGVLVAVESLITVDSAKPLLVAVGTISESDFPLALASGKTAQVGWIGETDMLVTVLGGSAQGVDVTAIAEAGALVSVEALKPIVRAVGLLSELDALQSLSSEKTASVGQVAGQEALQGLSAAKTALVGQVAQIETLLDIAEQKVANLGVISETDVLNAIAAREIVHVGIVAEIEALLNVASDESIVIGQLQETQTLVGVQSVKEIVQTIGTLNEIETLNLISSLKVLSVGILGETDTLNTVDVDKDLVILVDGISEVGSLPAVDPAKTAPVGILVELEALLDIQSDKTQSVSTITELDLLLDAAAEKPIIQPVGTIGETEVLRVVAAILGEPVILYMRVVSRGSRTNVLSRKNRTNVVSREYDAEQETTVKGAT